MTDSESIIQIVSRASLVKDYTSLQSVTNAFIASVDAKQQGTHIVKPSSFSLTG